MMMKFVSAAVAFAAATTIAFAANAGTILSIPGFSGDMPTDTFVLKSFNAGAGGKADLTFTIDGYNSLDGQNYYEDDFILKLNGQTLVAATFDLGGGGNDVIYKSPIDSVITHSGRQVTFDLPLELRAGNNLLAAAYVSLPQPRHAGFQGIGDEGWGIGGVSLRSAVPEPSTWALMLVGVGAVGFALRRPRAQALAA